MKQTKVFNINNKDMELPLFKKGDRVTVDKEREGVEATGTVDSITYGGLFVNVIWDQEKYVTETGSVVFGSNRLVDGLILLD